MAKYQISPELKGKSVVIDFTNVNDSAGNWLTKEGRYLFEVVAIGKKESQNSEYPNIVFTCEVVNSCSEKGKQINEYCTLNPKGLFRLRNMLVALTGKNIEKKAIRVDFSKMLGRKFVGVVAAEDSRTQKNADGTPKKLYKLVELLPASEWSNASSDDETEEDEEVPFDGEASETDVADDEVDDLDEEDLE